MKSIYVADLKDGDDLMNEPFLIQDIIRRETKDGRLYFLCIFRDKTGQINGVFWDVPDDVDGWVKPGSVALVTGRVNNYRSSLQIATTDLNPITVSSMAEFLPASRRTIDSMVMELRERISQLDEPWQKITARLLLDPDFLPRFANAPAARMMHHAFIGGLLDHTLSMAKIADFVVGHYPFINKSLLQAGVLLHDMGKTLEYETSASFDFSDDGRLVGHITRAAIMIEKAAEELGGISEEELRQLLHLVLSHHGNLEWGSPVVPKTLEAILLHQIDLLDSRVQGFFDHLRNDDSNVLWTSKTSYMFETELRRPPSFE